MSRQLFSAKGKVSATPKVMMQGLELLSTVILSATQGGKRCSTRPHKARRFCDTLPQTGMWVFILEVESKLNWRLYGWSLLCRFHMSIEYV